MFVMLFVVYGCCIAMIRMSQVLDCCATETNNVFCDSEVILLVYFRYWHSVVSLSSVKICQRAYGCHDTGDVTTVLKISSMGQPNNNTL